MSAGIVRFTGALARLSSAEREALASRASTIDEGVRERTAAIIARVRGDGDAALRALARELDGVELGALEVPRAEWERALASLDPALRRAMERSLANVRAVHAALAPVAVEVEPEPGIVVGRRPDALGRVGVYAPGGRAAYPSSVLMGVVPARVAGVGEITLCSPPGPNGLPSDVVLAAAALSGVDRVFAIGGAGAVAAMAYGTESIPRVDRIVGPGNAYVAEAKLQVASAVGIDSPAGPSELLVIADDTSDPAVVAREMIAQAEHDPAAAVVAVAIGEAAAMRVETELARQVSALTSVRGPIVRASLGSRGAVVWTRSASEAVEFSNQWAPEHLLIATSDAEALLAAVRNAGTVFVGSTASVAFGDYMTGANHVLPTGGLARSYSGLSTLDFVRWTTYQRVTREAAASLATDVAGFANAEGLPGHAATAAAWAAPVASMARTRRSASELARRDVLAIRPYGAGDSRPPRAVDLSDNVNAWGAPPAARRVLADIAAGGSVSSYPSAYSDALVSVAAEFYGVREEEIVTGCGSDDIIDFVMRAFTRPGDAVAFAAPTFSMVEAYARLNGLVVRPVAFREDFSLDVDALIGTGARLIYLCAPNNPTGTTLSRAQVIEVLERAPGMVILDEAYAEFAGVSQLDLIASSDRLIVTRTLSKAFGLASLRVGLGFSEPDVSRVLQRVRGPYRVSGEAERVACAALASGADASEWALARAAEAAAIRDRFFDALRVLGFAPLVSSANFVFVPAPEAVEISAALREQGIIVRVVSNVPSRPAALGIGGGTGVRIAVADWPTMKRVLDVMVPFGVGTLRRDEVSA